MPNKAYYEKNKDKIKEQNREWAELNREKRKKIALRSYHKKRMKELEKELEAMD